LTTWPGLMPWVLSALKDGSEGRYMKESRKDRCRRKVRDALESSIQPVSTSALARAARVSRNTTASCLAELRCQGLAKSYDVGSTRIWMVA
jgi:hypothetical protein